MQANFTGEDFLEQGSFDEESGDRWLGSDLAKAIRFYQKAYTSYKRAITLDLNPDTYYNFARLLFQVYYQFDKSNGIDLSDLSNIDEVFVADSVLQPLDLILFVHEQAIACYNKINQSPSNDLLFNTAMVYIEILESGNGSLNIALKAQQIFSSLMEYQVNQFSSFVAELQEVDTLEAIPSEPQEVADSGFQSKQEEYTSVETIQPSDIFESVINSYRLVQALLDNFPSDIRQIVEKFELFIFGCNQVSDNLISKFSELTAVNKMEYIENLTIDQVKDLIYAKNSIIASTKDNLQDILQLWESEENCSKKYMVVNDNIQSFIDRSTNLDSNTLWSSLSSMTNFLKLAYQDLKLQLTELQKSPNQSELSSIIIQICDILINRADIDVQRSQIDLEQAIKNQELLTTNAKNFLKLSINTSNISGGLREVARDKLQRQKKLLESKVRLSLIDGKNSVKELDQLVNRNKWIEELSELEKLEYYDKFGIDSLIEEGGF